MLDRAACERRVYRLAALLTGNPNAATKVIGQVIDSQPDLRNLDSAHMDRLTVLRSREIPPAALVHDSISREQAESLAGLNAQQREAWVLVEVYRVPEREAARAMDCSVTATQRHLEAARIEMSHHLGDTAPAAGPTLLAFSMTLEVPTFYRVEQRRQRATRLGLMALGLAAVAALIGAILLWWARPLSN